MARDDLLPSAKLHAPIGHVADDLLVEPGTDGLLAFQSLALGEAQGCWRIGPYLVGHLVAAKMEERQRRVSLLIHQQHLVDHLLHEGQRGGQSGVHHVVVVALGRGVLGGVVGIGQTIFHGLGRVGLLVFLIACLHRADGSACMAGTFHLGHHADMARLGIAQQVDKLLAGEVAVARRGTIGIVMAVVAGIETVALVVGVATPTTHLREFGQSGYLQSPTFVVAEVEMEHAELVVGQGVNDLQQVRVGREVARDVDHLSSIGEVGPVLDIHGMKFPIGIEGIAEQGKERARGVPDGMRALADYTDSIGPDAEFVVFLLRGGQAGIDGQTDRHTLCSIGQSVLVGQVGGEKACLVARLCIRHEAESATKVAEAVSRHRLLHRGQHIGGGKGGGSGQTGVVAVVLLHVARQFLVGKGLRMKLHGHGLAVLADDEHPFGHVALATQVAAERRAEDQGVAAGKGLPGLRGRQAEVVGQDRMKSQLRRAHLLGVHRQLREIDTPVCVQRLARLVVEDKPGRELAVFLRQFLIIHAHLGLKWHRKCEQCKG